MFCSLNIRWFFLNFSICMYWALFLFSWFYLLNGCALNEVWKFLTVGRSKFSLLFVIGFYLWFSHWTVETKLSVFQGWSLETVLRALNFPLLSINPMSTSLVLGILEGLSLAGCGTEKDSSYQLPIKTFGLYPSQICFMFVFSKNGKCQL